MNKIKVNKMQLSKQFKLRLKTLKADAFRRYVAAADQRVWIAGNSCDSKRDVEKKLVKDIKFAVNLERMTPAAVSGGRDTSSLDKAMDVIDGLLAEDDNVLDEME